MKIKHWLAGLLEWPLRHRQLKLMKSRHSYSKTQFIKDFDNSDAECKIAAEVWDALRKEAVISEFKPKPEDSLLEVFGLADEDLDDVVLALLNSCHCRIPSNHEIETTSPVYTVADLVKFIALFKITEV
jgi:hypothetical protein